MSNYLTCGLIFHHMKIILKIILILDHGPLAKITNLTMALIPLLGNPDPRHRWRDAQRKFKSCPGDPVELLEALDRR